MSTTIIITIMLKYLLFSGNSYPQIGHTLESEDICIAQDGHSFCLFWGNDFSWN